MKSKERIKRWADYWDENPQNREKHICEEEKVTLGHSLGFFSLKKGFWKPLSCSTLSAPILEAVILVSYLPQDEKGGKDLFSLSLF